MEKDDENYMMIDRWEKMFTTNYFDQLLESIDMQKYLKEYSNGHIIKIKKDDELYRARIFKTPMEKKAFYNIYFLEYFVNNKKLFNDLENLPNSFILGIKYNCAPKSNVEKIVSQIKGGFHGYNAKESGAPPKSSSLEGRANIKGETVLYLSKEKETCVYEIDAETDNIISVGIFKAKKDLQLVDFINQYEAHNNSAHYIRSIYSNRNDENLYKKSQIITRYLKNLNYDGVAYSSAKKDGGTNYAIFNPDNFECISSELAKVKSIKLDIKFGKE